MEEAPRGEVEGVGRGAVVEPAVVAGEQAGEQDLGVGVDLHGVCETASSKTFRTLKRVCHAGKVKRFVQGICRHSVPGRSR